MKNKWKFAFGVAATNDLLDITPIGALPFSGTLVDILSNILLWPVLKTRRSLITIIEYLPGFGALPVYTATVLYAYSRRESDGKRKIEVK